MAGSPARKRHFGSIILSVACIGVAAAVGWSIVGKRTQSQAIAAPGDVTGSISGEAQRPLGPSGLPIPRFVSLKAEKVNVRRGPSSEHPVAWVFQRKGLPVEIVAEFENWRRVRDSDGEEGWILQNMLSGKRTAVIGGGNSGVEAAIDLAGIVAHVTLLEFADNRLLATLCGEYDRNLVKMEAELGVQVIHRGNQLHIIGEAAAITRAATR
jgi:SH3-like domain-containing protein